MRHLSRVLCSVAMVATTAAGCGGSATTTGSQSTRPVFPLTVSRTGGIAGFRDVLVVSASGLVSVTSKGQQPRQCRLTPAVTRQLTAAASAVAWSQITPANTRASFPDDLVSTMASPAGGPVRLENSQAGAAGQLLLELLTDASGPTDSRLCRPV